jgi:hypothetical protein
MPPECLVAMKPAGAAPRPASRRLMIAPLSGRGGWMIRAVWEHGDCVGTISAMHSSWPGEVPAIHEFH